MARILIIIITITTGVLFTGCNTTFPGRLGLATWEFQFNQKKPKYQLDEVAGNVVKKDKYCISTQKEK